MKRVLQFVSMVTILTVSARESATASEEKKERILMGDVPPAVQMAFKEQAGVAKILRVEKGNKGGKTVYDAVASENGKETRIEVGEDGKLLGTHKKETPPARGIRSSPASSRPTPTPLPAPRPAVTSPDSNSTDKSGSVLPKDMQNSGSAQLKDEDTRIENGSLDNAAKLTRSRKHHYRWRYLRLPFF
jgi:hypothetical protein